MFWIEDEKTKVSCLNKIPLLFAGAVTISLVLSDDARTQEDITAELELLQAKYFGAEVTKPTTGVIAQRDGLAIIWYFKSPRGADGFSIDKKYREAAKRICLKNGRYRFEQLRQQEEYKELRYFVVKLMHETTSLGVFTFKRHISLEFDFFEDCKEI